VERRGEALDVCVLRRLAGLQMYQFDPSFNRPGQGSNTGAISSR